MKTFFMILILSFSTAISFAAANRQPPPVGSGFTRMAGCDAIEKNRVPTNAEEGFQIGICLGQLNTALYFLAQENCFHTQDMTVYDFAVMVNNFMRTNPHMRSMDFNKIMYLAAGATYDCSREKS